MCCRKCHLPFKRQFYHGHDHIFLALFGIKSSRIMADNVICDFFALLFHILALSRLDGIAEF